MTDYVLGKIENLTRPGEHIDQSIHYPPGARIQAGPNDTITLASAIQEAIAGERQACAAAMCYWCRWKPEIRHAHEGMVHVEPAARTSEGKLHPHAHVLIYKDGGRGAVKCDATPIWGRG